MDCQLCRSVQLAREGRHPSLIAELRRSVVVLGENQGCRGWCVLVYNGHAEHVAALAEGDQRELWADVSRVAGAIRAVFPLSGTGGGPPRINYECLGNLVPHIHWHVIPRHADDPEPTKAVWGWPEERLREAMNGEERKELVARLRTELER